MNHIRCSICLHVHPLQYQTWLSYRLIATHVCSNKMTNISFYIYTENINNCALLYTLLAFCDCVVLRSLVFLLVGHSQGQVLSHAMNGSTSHPQRPLSPPSYPPPPASLHTGLPRQSRSSGESLFFCFFPPIRDASHCPNAWLGKW